MNSNIAKYICAGIVTYNPNIELLTTSIKSIIRQVKCIVIIDNASSNLRNIEYLLSQFSNIHLISNNTNKGIAYALNQIAEHAHQNACTWFLTLDQDSVCPENLIKEYSQYISFSDVALICPYILQRIHINDKLYFKDDYKYIQIAITSGSLVKLEAWIDVNGFWNELFIDRVDDDFCLALRDKGWKVLQTYRVKLEHEIGYPEVRHFMGKTYYTDSYPDFRYYYIARNTILVCAYYKNLPYNMYVMLLKKLFKIILGEKHKIKKIKSFLRGMQDGRIMVKNGLERKSECII